MLSHTFKSDKWIIAMLYKEKKNYRQSVYFISSLLLLSAGAYFIEVKTQLNIAHLQLNSQLSLIEQLGKQQHKVVHELNVKLSEHVNTVDALSTSLAAEKKRYKKFRYQYKHQSKQIALHKQQVKSQADLEVQQIVTKYEQQKEEQQVTIKKSDGSLKDKNQQRVDELMAEFNALKVNLDIINKCDKAYVARHGQAKSLLNHMRTYIQQHKMNQDYYYFIISNDVLISRKARELCIES